MLPSEIKKQVRALPQKSGVYFLLSRKGEALYIGKAAHLRTRVQSHFSRSASSLSAVHNKLIAETRRIAHEETNSQMEALVREAELIKRRRPRYNILMRDDKNYSFAGFTRETFPRIFCTHQPSSEVRRARFGGKTARRAHARGARFIGPFTDARALKESLRALRTLFPYCTCRRMHRGTCLNAHVGRCPGYCCDSRATPTERERRVYRSHIAALREILMGKKKRILVRLRRQMERASLEERFEDAARVRDRLRMIETVLAHAHVLRDWRALYSSGEGGLKALEEIASLMRLARLPHRIEAYDISNIHGKWAAGSLAVFHDGERDPAWYRRFRIKTVSGSNDVAMIREVLRRRLAHMNWPMPDLIVIDGGKPQLSGVLSVLRTHGANIPVVALAKREERLYRGGCLRPVKLAALPTPVRHLLQRLRDEAHRLAISYYRKLHQRSVKIFCRPSPPLPVHTKS